MGWLNTVALGYKFLNGEPALALFLLRLESKSIVFIVEDYEFYHVEIIGDFCF